MFSKISPQKVSHSEGYVVQVVDRYHVGYVENDKTAIVEVDFAPVIGIYGSSLENWENGDSLTDTEKKLVLKRISEALIFMGSKVEIC